MRKILFLTLALLTTSCANYINKMYNELDGVNQRELEQKRANVDNTFDQYRNSYGDRRQTSANTPNMAPQVQRRYNNNQLSQRQQQQQQPKRVTANNFHDHGNTGSLWAGNGNENYLFTKNKWKRNGDIILVNVQTRLKNDITMELKRAFPPMPTLAGQNPESTTAATTPGQAQTPAGAGAEEGEDTSASNKVHDKISGVIVEEISRDHLLVRGQKNVLFKNRKHLVELQALISRKDINEDDTIDSTKFLESSVTVLR
ncbi:flagellar basal body L-ring protein FlgH [Halobacteriovorax sp. HFRX-2_2]|uniref:flagellar basal body L-ring protein FlgH n=1 Tax=unclassified Halobacteriovorax TaxID=2639665 RepID=UPI0037193A07